VFQVPSLHQFSSAGRKGGHRNFLVLFFDDKKSIFKKLNTDLPYDPAMPLLGTYPKEYNSCYSRGTCTPVFIAALVTIAKLWKQPRCPTTDEWIKKMWCLYTMEFYAAMKKNEILSLASKWMDLENIILSKVSQAQKAKNHMFSLMCGL
jgi:hypothetical protein